jgi:hypothetical protein
MYMSESQLYCTVLRKKTKEKTIFDLKADT